MKPVQEENLTTPTPAQAQAQDGSFLDQALRPNKWDEYIGQNPIKENLKILLTAAAQRKHPPEHILFYGPPGLGKTTLAHLIAKEIGANIKITSGPAIEKVGDLASILTNLASGDILFIDEIHRLNKAIEEVLYPAMESGSLDIIIGKGPSARTVQLELPPFTLIAATTRIAMISSPLRSRFSGGVFRLELYSKSEIEQILERSAAILGIGLSPHGKSAIAERSRSTPRTANYFLKRCRDYAQVRHAHQGSVKGADGLPGKINSPGLDRDVVEKSLTMLGVDSLGLNQTDRNLLEVLIKKFKGGPVGLNTLAAALSEEQSTIEDVQEPYLLQQGLIERTSRGRKATDAAYSHLALKA